MPSRHISRLRNSPYITQILKGGPCVFGHPRRPRALTPLKDEIIGGKYKLKKGTFVLVPSDGVAPRSVRSGTEPEAFDPENFSPEAEAARPVNAWKPFRQRPARLAFGRGLRMHEAALAIGMILQRFKADPTSNRYQMHLKETRTIKPDDSRSRCARALTRNAARTPAAAMATAGRNRVRPAAPRARTRPATIRRCYATDRTSATARNSQLRVADLAERQRLCDQIGPPLDDFVGQIAGSRAASDFLCVVQNGRRPITPPVQMSGHVPKHSFAKVRYAAYPAAGNSDGLHLQSISRPSTSKRRPHGRARRVYPAARADARSDLDGQIRKLVASLRHWRQGIRHRFELQPQRQRRAALKIDPVAPSG